MRGPDDQPFGEEWIVAYFAEVDRMDPDGLLAWYDDEGSFRFAGQPAVCGKEAIRATLAAFYASIRSMSHRATGVWTRQSDRSGVMEAEVVFTRGDGERVVIPAVSTLRLKGDRVHDFRFVMDPAPLTGGQA